MDTQQTDFQRYLASIGRCKFRAAVVMMLTFTLGLLITFNLPPVYLSSAKILIQEQEIPEKLVRPTLTAYADQRLEIIEQVVLTNQNLENIVSKYGLDQIDTSPFDLGALLDRVNRVFGNSDVPEQVGDPAQDMDQAIDHLRKSIKLETVTADIVDHRTGRPRQALIAFELSYESRDPQITKAITQELADLFIKENAESRHDISKHTVDFLSEQTARLDEQVTAMELELANFRRLYPNQLPESSDLNSKSIERIERHILDIDTKLGALQTKRTELRTRLAKIDSQLTLDSTSSKSLDPTSRLAALRAEYTMLSERYPPQYPDVKRLKEQIASMEKQQIESSGSNSPTTQTNPAYASLRAELSAVYSEIVSLQQRQKELREQMDRHVDNGGLPAQALKDYLSLRRNYNDTLEQLRSLRSKEKEAELGYALEQKGKGERFSLSNPAKLPSEPSKPNRLALVFLTLILSITGGLGYVALHSSFDPYVRGADEIAEITGAYPLASFPNRDDKQLNR